MRRFIVALCLSLAAAPAIPAKPIPDFSEFSAEELGILANVFGRSLKSDDDAAAALAIFDEALTKLSRPTKARGMMQMSRAGALSALNRDSEAVLAIRESIRLLPENSAPLLAGAEILAYVGKAGEAADLFLRASRLDPEEAAQVSTYEINNLLGRLNIDNQTERRTALLARLIDIGWTGDTLTGRSDVVVEVIRDRLVAGDLAGARALVPELLDPEDHYALLTANFAAPIWDDILAWTGPRLTKQWPVYLREARRRYEASKAPASLKDYLAALRKAEKDDVILADLAPKLLAPTITKREEPYLFAAAATGVVLTRAGRIDEMEQMYANLERIWPLEKSANALNLTLNHAIRRMEIGRPSEAIDLLDAALAQAATWGPQVNTNALVSGRLARACALYLAGRKDEAAVAASESSRYANLDVDGVIFMYLCLDQMGDAKAVALRYLDDGDRYGVVLRLLQRQPPLRQPSLYLTKLRSGVEALRADKEVMRAVARRGRILDFVLSEGVPAVVPD